MSRRTLKTAAKTVVESALPVWEINMNPEQLEVIRHEEGPAVVLAQAGAGKTRALVHRIVRLIEQCGVAPASILAVTFSKKAADEMNERLRQLGCDDARIGTWHSLCLQILKDDDTEWASWTVDEKGSAKICVKEAIGYKFLNWKDADLGAVERFISICKANLWAPRDPEAVAHAKAVFGGYSSEMAIKTFEISQKMIEERGILTFDDFLVFVHRHLQDESNRKRWAGKWNFVLQDEAQDANRAQKTIATLLSQDHRNYMAIGDIAQSIYGFRGSTPQYLVDFEKDWPGAKVIIMNRNYRSGRQIITAANNIIRPAAIRMPTDMIAERDLDGSAKIMSAPDLDGEAQNFTGWVVDNVRNGAKYSDMTCLFRTNAQSRALEEALLSSKIPYVVVGGTSFYERKEVKSLLGYLRVAAGLDKDGEAVQRCINAPFRFLGKAFVETVMSIANRNDEVTPNWPGIIELAAQKAGIQRRQVQSANEWASIIGEVASDIRKGGPDGKPSVLLGWIVNKTSYLDWLVKEEGAESIESSHAANVRELIRVAERFESVQALLEYIDANLKAARKQRGDKQAGGERVLLMSIHRSKGLEWPHLFVVGCNEKILPHAMGDAEEERRLAYVAATRARDSLVLSYVNSFATREGIKEASPSRFLSDSGIRMPSSEEDPEVPPLELTVQNVLDDVTPEA